MSHPITTENLDFYPLTPERWSDFVELFAPDITCSGCWCMFWRITRKEFQQNGGKNNKKAMANLVHSGKIPGIIGYRSGQPVTWCSIAPREDFASLERSHTLKRPDDQPVWSIVCFFVAKTARKAGLLEETIQAAVKFAGNAGAALVEAYPVSIIGKRSPGELYMGTLKAFLDAGFYLVENRGAHSIVRFQV